MIEKRIPEPLRRLLNDIGLLLLRVIPGFLLLAFHGWPKIGRLTADKIEFADPIGVGPVLSLILAIFAEVVCAALVMLGLFTRAAAFPVVFLLVVAAVIVHWDDPFKVKEFALIFAIPFLVLMFTGPGRLSLDALLWGGKKKD